MALLTDAINSAPELIQKVPATLMESKRYSRRLILVWLIPAIGPLFIPWLSMELYSQYPDHFTVKLLLPICVMLAVVLLTFSPLAGRSLKAGLALHKLWEVCERTGWNPQEWCKLSRIQPTEERYLLLFLLDAFLWPLALVALIICLIYTKWPPGVLAVLVVPLVCGYFYLHDKLTKAKEQRARTRLTDLTVTASGDALIVYLRGFKDDKELAMRDPFAGRHSGRTIEEEICLAAAEPGKRIVALGRPGEELPPLGSDRYYVEDHVWQEVISGWMQRASQLLMIASTTAATKWEKEEAQRLGCLPRMLILFPNISQNRTQETFNRIQHLTGVELQTPVLDERTFISGIYFTSDNSPHLIVSATRSVADLIETIKWHKQVLQNA